MYAFFYCYYIVYLYYRFPERLAKKIAGVRARIVAAVPERRSTTTLVTIFFVSFYYHALSTRRENCHFPASRLRFVCIHAKTVANRFDDCHAVRPLQRQRREREREKTVHLRFSLGFFLLGIFVEIPAFTGREKIEYSQRVRRISKRCIHTRVHCTHTAPGNVYHVTLCVGTYFWRNCLWAGLGFVC